MDEKERKDIIAVLERAIEFLEKEDFAGLKEVSNHTIHNASILQDGYSIQIAVVIYALSKILERAKMHDGKISMDVISTLERAMNDLRQNKVDDYDNEIKKIFKQISEKDEKLFMYIQGVVEQAHIVKGSKLYEHGLSIGRAAEILGVPQWELMSFIGKTRITDEEPLPLTDITARLNFTKRLFRVP